MHSAEKSGKGSRGGNSSQIRNWYRLVFALSLSQSHLNFKWKLLRLIGVGIFAFFPPDPTASPRHRLLMSEKLFRCFGQRRLELLGIGLECAIDIFGTIRRWDECKWVGCGSVKLKSCDKCCAVNEIKNVNFVPSAPDLGLAHQPHRHACVWFNEITY